jgi:hypothetical protein
VKINQRGKKSHDGKPAAASVQTTHIKLFLCFGRDKLIMKFTNKKLYFRCIQIDTAKKPSKLKHSDQ